MSTYTSAQAMLLKFYILIQKFDLFIFILYKTNLDQHTKLIIFMDNFLNVCGNDIKKLIINYHDFSHHRNIHVDKWNAVMGELTKNTEHIRIFLFFKQTDIASVVKTSHKKWFILDTSLAANQQQMNQIENSINSKISWLFEIDRKNIEIWKCVDCNCFLYADELEHHTSRYKCLSYYVYNYMTTSQYTDYLGQFIQFIGHNKHTVKSLLGIIKRAEINKHIENTLNIKRLPLPDPKSPPIPIRDNIDDENNNNTYCLDEIISERDFEFSDNENEHDYEDLDSDQFNSGDDNYMSD